VALRKVMQDAAEKNGHHYKKSLEESLQLQRLLRKLTHRMMVSQEVERKNISRELQDEIAQTLLGINVRLLSLKQHARTNTKGLKAEIASTQRLVLQSAQSVRRVAREIGYHPESVDGSSLP
jgi:signal transduction histidine kinase